MMMAFAWLLQVANPQATAPPLQAAEWVADLDTLVARLTRVHPRPFRRIASATFTARAATLRAAIPRLTDDAIAVRMMALVASLRDGHTSLAPFGTRAGFTRWYPVRFYRFTDGVFITAIQPELAHVAGARVLRIGALDAGHAADSAATLLGADNEFGDREHTMMLSSPEALSALGINASRDSLALDVETCSGERTTVRIASIVVPQPSLGWAGNGEIDGPTGTRTVTAFGVNRARLLDPDSNPSLPLHLRGRRAYWYTYVDSARSMFLQLNAMTDKSVFSPITFVENYRRAFAYIDAHPDAVDRLVIDLRYNFGGNGDLVDGFVHELIKREATVNRAGHLFVLTGRKTFSAGADLLLQIRRHTAAIIVGEPPGVGFNASGDPTDVVLPNSGFHVSISTNWGQSAGSSDTSSLIPVEVPAQFSSADYFEKRDPALDLIFTAPVPFPTVIGTLRSAGVAAGDALFRERSARFGNITWWQPFKLNDVNNLGYNLLGQKNADDAATVFRLNTIRFPDSWYVWDSLADAYLAANRRELARAALERALAADASNPEAENERKKLAQLKASPD
jgi:hypothetical protein